MEIVVIYCIISIVCLKYVNSITYSLSISPEEHINEVDERFLSFTVDPAFLFARPDRKQLTCMATALAPAFVRVAGPSTDRMKYYNYTVTVEDANWEPSQAQNNLQRPLGSKDHLDQFLIITHTQWLEFVHWAQGIGLDLVFALSHHERTSRGLWDPNSALSILTIADSANLTDIHWELGYKCHNQTIDDYLLDVETLRFMVEQFPSSLERRWKVAAGDVSPCIANEIEFRDYYSIAVEMMDTILMNGNSSAYYFSQLSEADRINLLQILNFSPRPLWLTDGSRYREGPQRAADWLTALGHAAGNGYKVHYRHLHREEIYAPTMSLYMALLYKNLVGARVLPLQRSSDPGAAVFAHCTALRRQVVPGAVTIYAVNMKDETARFKISWPTRERGGDVLRFILTHDHNGNIVINGKEMQSEGEIPLIIKRVSPYKNLLLNLPSKSFGFWVLANTNITACKDFKKKKNKTNSTENETDELNFQNHKVKRAANIENDESDVSEIDFSEETLDKKVVTHPALQQRIDSLNKNIKNIREIFKSNSKNIMQRLKRQLLEDNRVMQDKDRRKPRRQGLKTLIEKLRNNHEELRPKNLLEKLLELHPKLNSEVATNDERQRKNTRIVKYRVTKPNTNLFRKTETLNENEHKIFRRQKRSILDQNTYVRKQPRHIIRDHKKNEYVENEIEDEKFEKVKKTTDYGLKYSDYFDQIEDDKSIEFPISEEENLSKDSEISDKGLVDSTIRRLISVLQETNVALTRFWKMLSIVG